MSSLLLVSIYFFDVSILSNEFSTDNSCRDSKKVIYDNSLYK